MRRSYSIFLVPGLLVVGLLAFSACPNPAATPSASPTPSPVLSPTPTIIPTPVATSTPICSPSVPPTPTPTLAPTPTPMPTPELTPSPTPMPTLTQSPTPPPQADFVGSPTVCNGQTTVQFTDQSTGEITSWSWDFGDGHTSTLQNPSNYYTNNGLYTVTLAAAGPGGTDVETKNSYIYVQGCST